MNPQNKWPEEHVEILRRMWAEGRTATAIGEAIGRTRKAVQTKAEKLKLPRKIKSSIKRAADWPDERFERLKTMWAAGKSSIEIAKVLGVTRSAVMGKIVRAKLPGRKGPTSRGQAEWTLQAVATLKDMWNAGAMSAVIAEKLGFTRKAVLSKADRLGLPRRDKIAAMRLAPRKQGPRGPRTYTAQPKPKWRMYREFVGPPAPPVGIESAKVLAMTSFGECRWPIFEARGEHLFCCRPVSGKRSYCREHAEMSVGRAMRAVRPSDAPRHDTGRPGYYDGEFPETLERKVA